MLLAASGFAALAGKRVGLITNQTGRVGGEHLADLLSKAPGLKLAAIFAPEHGFRGKAEAGASVRGGVDAKTGVPILSLYGATRKPTQAMLRNVDVLVFDIQDVGARFYTYISTMGLAMQAAAAARIPFVVLDRPNPLGGEYVSGFVLEPSLRSFVGQYPIPIVHGLTVGELARMIKGEALARGPRRARVERRRDAGLAAVHALAADRARVGRHQPEHPDLRGGTGLSRHRHRRRSRGQRGARHADALLAIRRALARCGAHGGQTECARPSRRDVSDGDLHAALDPRRRRAPAFRGHEPDGVRVAVTDVALVEPLEIGMHALAAIAAAARAKGVTPLFANLKMLHAIAGTRRLLRMLDSGSDGSAIIAAWQSEVAQFKALREAVSDLLRAKRLIRAARSA